MVFGLGGWYFADPETMINSSVIAIVALIVGTMAITDSTQRNQRQAALWVGGAFLMAVPLMTAVQPFLVMNNAMVPMMVGLMLLQYGPQQTTRLAMILCALTAVVTALCGTLMPLLFSFPTQLPTTLIYALQLSSFSATTGIIFLLTGQFWQQRSDALSRLQTANTQLDAANATLYHTNQQLDAANNSLRDLALRDPLTGLFNRRYVDETLDLEIYRAQRSGLPIGVLLIDLDYFKQVNDTYGHDAGDTLLQVVADVLQDQVRSGDIVARYGGEEFLMVLPGIPYPPLAERADRIRVAIQRLQVVHAGQDLGQRSCSIGVALYPDHGPESTTIIKAADDALYAAKAAGRNQVVVATALAAQPHVGTDTLTP
ncbi:MAG: GGDEF domain-containing protein [Chloroflexota bacterium]